MPHWLFDSPKVRFQSRSPDPDPFERPGRRHWNRTTGRRLTPTNFMPIGTHRGKPMDRIPIAYLAWVYAHDWSRQDDWAPVRQFCELYVIEQRPEEWKAAIEKATESEPG